MKYEDVIRQIKAADPAFFAACKRNWNQVAKPLNSLGDFELLTAKIAAAQGRENPCINKRKVLVFCADNGVVEEGVSQSDHSVTTAVAKALVLGTSNVNLFAKEARADVAVYDVGMVDDVAGINKQKMICGTKNFAKEAAMSQEETKFALEVGMEAALRAKEEGYDILVIGEMGIGNTTTSTAICAALLQEDAALLCGRGSGLSDAGLQTKIRIIKEGLALHGFADKTADKPDALDVLSKVGGADIAAMCGVLLAGAACGLPIVLDGFISAAAALVAVFVDARVKDYLIPSHNSHEAGAAKVLSYLGLKAPIDAQMALGEGTGGVMLLPLLDMALALYRGNHKFTDIGIAAYKEMK